MTCWAIPRWLALCFGYSRLQVSWGLHARYVGTVARSWCVPPAYMHVPEYYGDRMGCEVK